jgi:5-formyltetrahydrofolate cyclo-ligase
MTKAEIRKQYIQKRDVMSDDEYAQLNDHLREQFFAHIDLSFVKVVHTFIPIKNSREPDTWLITNRIRVQYPNIRLSVPRVNNQTGELENFYFEGLHQLKTNTWGIPEPMQGEPTEPGKIDMVFVPLLAFDLKGHRVGYGKGFYDKFLSLCKPSCQRIGISLFPPIDKIDDIRVEDQLLTAAVTPKKFVQF